MIKTLKMISPTTCTTFTPCWFSFKSTGDNKIC